jgi:D-alanyl-D-alanine carboxypeptidase/D-alanyl-D-alanine-endopeptidase (penicillin-binding protein 4)
VALVLALGARAAGADAPLPRALAAALDASALRGARVGALVVDAERGAVLFERAPDLALVPASNLKILTALAALDAFGPAHRFTTRVLANAPVDAEGAVDVLYLQGGGDPALTSESWWRLAADLRLAGLREVRRGIVVDDSAFDAARWHPSWGRVTSRAYYAPIGALSANYGAFAVEVRPGPAPGAPLAVTLDPPVASLRVVTRARTGPPGSPSTLVVDRVAAGELEEVRVAGSLAAGAEPESFYRSVADPGRYAGALARLQLEANGVRVGAGLARGGVPLDATELLAFEGRPLGEIVGLLVKHSNNEIAEALVKALAAQRGAGSWELGTALVRERLVGLGLDASGLELVDGSGLSTGNRVSARLLVDALRVAGGSFRLGPELLAALPIAARDGTLRKRAGGADGRVRAKTGLLDRVTALSGYAELADGRTAAFAVLVNGYRVADEAAMDAVDAFVSALVSAEPGALEPAASASSRAAWIP